MGRGISASGRSLGGERSRKRGSWPLSLLLSVVLHAGMIAGVIIAFWPAGVLIALGPSGDDPRIQVTVPGEERSLGHLLAEVASEQTSTPPASSLDGANTSNMTTLLLSPDEGGKGDSEYATRIEAMPQRAVSEALASEPSEQSSGSEDPAGLIDRLTAPQTGSVVRQIAPPSETPVTSPRSDKRRSVKRHQERPASNFATRSASPPKREAAVREGTLAGSPAPPMVRPLPPPSAVSSETVPEHPKAGLPPVEPAPWVQPRAPSWIPSTFESGAPTADARSEWLRRLRPIPFLGPHRSTFASQAGSPPIADARP
jgi:hypothetical protein